MTDAKSWRSMPTSEILDEIFSRIELLERPFDGPWASPCNLNSVFREYMADTLRPPKPYFWLGAEAEGV